MRFIIGEKAASASEYAAIFAVVVIALMVCVNILGRNLGRAVQSANAKINGDGAYTLAAGPAGGLSAGSNKEPDAESDERGAETAYVREVANDAKDSPGKTAGRPDEEPNAAPADVSAVRKLLKGDQSGPSPKKN